MTVKLCGNEAEYLELRRRANVVFWSDVGLPNSICREGFAPGFFLEEVEVWIEALPTLLEMSLAVSGAGLSYVQLSPPPAFSHLFPAFQVHSMSEIGEAQELIANGVDGLIDTEMRVVHNSLVILPAVSQPRWGIFADHGFEFAVFGSCDESLTIKCIEFLRVAGSPQLLFVNDVSDILEDIFGNRNPAYVKKTKEELERNYGMVREPAGT